MREGVQDEMRPAATGAQLRMLCKQRVVRLLAVIVLFSALGAASVVYVHSVYDPDVWWHLKVGDWIRENHQVPHNGIFSRTADNLPWTAYSWGYEVQLSYLYSAFGLLGIGIDGLMLTLLVMACTFWCALRLSRGLWTAVLLTLAACSAFLYLMLPRPGFFSMALFAILITLLFETQRSGDERKLYFLPVIFFLWANIHIQFVYGLVALGLFVLVATLGRIIELRTGRNSSVESPAVPLAKLWVIFAACVGATFIGPYGPRLYETVWGYSRAKYTYGMITELFAPDFRGVTYFVELFLIAAAYFAIGWRKRMDIFSTLLLVISTACAFRTLRDAWFACIVSLAIVANTLRSDDSGESESGFKWPEVLTMAAVVSFVLLLVARNTDFTTRGLDRAAGTTYPIKAANFIRRYNLPGPIFNSFNWGGFLMWYLPQYPVSIDGRNDLYGDELDSRLDKTEAGEVPYQNEPIFTSSRLFLIRSDVPLAALLAMDPEYQAIYRDNLSVVFIKRNAELSNDSPNLNGVSTVRNAYARD